MERKTWFLIGGVVLAGIVIAAVAFTGTRESPAGQVTEIREYRYRPESGPGGYQIPGIVDNTTPLTADETNDILFLREEEQMAFDLYTRWGANYTLPVFANIARSETVHISRVQALIDRYDLGTYRIGNVSAGYTDERIQAL